MKLPRYLVLLLAVFCFVAFLSVDADARRMGGGRSFGSKPSYSKSFSKSVSPSKSTTQKSGSSRRSGFGRGGMGLLGGLLAGSMLGSLFFGGGFMGPGIMDFLLIGIVIFLALKLFKGRSRGTAEMQQQGYYQRGPDPRSQGGHPNQSASPKYESNARSAWDHLSSKSSGAAPQQEESVGAIPADFDQEDFLKGAKAMYNRLQNSWDERNLDDIRQFTTEDVYKEIAEQAADDPGPSKTEVLLVNARILEVKNESGQMVATVYYDVLMREDLNQSQPSQVREVWHFAKDSSPQGVWKLDGIQQLED